MLFAKQRYRKECVFKSYFLLYVLPSCPFHPPYFFQTCICVQICIRVRIQRHGSMGRKFAREMFDCRPVVLLVLLAVLLPASVEGHCTNVSIATISTCTAKYTEPSTSAAASDICTYLNDFGKCYTTNHCCDDDHNGNWTFFKNTLSKFTPKIEEAKYSCVVFCRNANITKYRYPAIPANPNPSDGTRMVPVGIFGLVTCVSMLAIALL